MSLTINDVKRVAQLARIEIGADEAQTALQQLAGIFSLIEQMQAVNTATITPMAHAQELSQRLRDDIVTEGDQREQFHAIAPQVEAGLYLLPRVVE